MTKKSVVHIFIDSMLKYKLNFILSALLGAFGMQIFGFLIWIPMMLIDLGVEGKGGFFTDLMGILMINLYNLAIFLAPLIKNIQYFISELKKQGIHKTMKLISSIMGCLILCYFIVEVVMAIVLIPLADPKTFYTSFYDMNYVLGPIVVPIVFLIALWIVRKFLYPKEV